MILNVRYVCFPESQLINAEIFQNLNILKNYTQTLGHKIIRNAKTTLRFVHPTALAFVCGIKNAQKAWNY